VKSITKGAKIDKITEKRQFPMDFFHETFNYSISPMIQSLGMISGTIQGVVWQDE
jgi:hypothetical protein